MKLTINDLGEAMSSYQNINKEKFPVKTAYKLMRLFQDISKEVECYETVVKDTLMKYAKKDEEGNPIIHKSEQGENVEIPKDLQEKCLKEINELGNSEVEIKDSFFTIEDFGDINVSLEELKGLIPFIKEE